jgi:putative phosphoribosyl transferase
MPMLVNVETDEPTGTVRLLGDLVVPDNAHGAVLFAHGSGSSRHSPRNRAVAEMLHQHGLATLLLDLLTEDEERVDLATTELRFDIDLLGRRLVDALDGLAHWDATRQLPVGVFGASTGAAGALVAAAERPDRVAAVVSRGGRPDLAGGALASVRAPTLLIVGGHDDQVLALNRQAMSRIAAPVRLEIVAHATHLFEEPGALDQVGQLAAEWFDERLR